MARISYITRGFTELHYTVLNVDILPKYMKLWPYDITKLFPIKWGRRQHPIKKNRSQKARPEGPSYLRAKRASKKQKLRFDVSRGLYTIPYHFTTKRTIGVKIPIRKWRFAILRSTRVENFQFREFAQKFNILLFHATKHFEHKIF